jgi:hypothetical protein
VNRRPGKHTQTRLLVVHRVHDLSSIGSLYRQDWPPHEVFVDRDIHPGDEWANRIFREAEACEAMLFLASEASLKPDSFCYKELQRARGVTIAVTLGGLRPEDERLRSALPHGADVGERRQMLAPHAYS